MKIALSLQERHFLEIQKPGEIDFVANAGKKMDLTQQRVSQIVDGLEKKMLMKKVSRPNTRLHYFRITARGKNLLKTLAPLVEASK